MISVLLIYGQHWTPASLKLPKLCDSKTQSYSSSFSLPPSAQFALGVEAVEVGHQLLPVPRKARTPQAKAFNPKSQL